MYKQNRSFDQRCQESSAMLRKYPERVPVIIEPKNESIPFIDKNKYMSPRDLTFSQLMYVVRRRLNLRPEQALFFFLPNNELVVAASSIDEIYNRRADKDGFLYVTYNLEHSFGVHVPKHETRHSQRIRA